MDSFLIKMGPFLFYWDKNRGTLLFFCIIKNITLVFLI